MKIAVVGVGGMGCVYAGLLGAAGNDVWALDINAEHIKAIAERGLRVEGASGDRVVRINATTNPSEIGIVDLVIVATKAMDVQAAVRSIADVVVGPESVVLSIQNGIGGPEAAADVLGEGVVVGVAGGFGASIVSPGHVHHHGLELLRVGELSGGVTARVEQVAAILTEAGFNVKAYDDVQTLVWEKLLCNVCFSGSSAILGFTIGEIIENPDAWEVAAKCAEEAYTVATRKGITLGFSDATSYVRNFGLTIPGARPSMLLDVLAGRPTEVDYINGAIVRLGTELAINVDVNRTVVSLVRAREAVV